MGQRDECFVTGLQLRSCRDSSMFLSCPMHHRSTANVGCTDGSMWGLRLRHLNLSRERISGMTARPVTAGSRSRVYLRCRAEQQVRPGAGPRCQIRAAAWKSNLRRLRASDLDLSPQPLGSHRTAAVAGSNTRFGSRTRLSRHSVGVFAGIRRGQEPNLYVKTRRCGLSSIPTLAPSSIRLSRLTPLRSRDSLMP